MTYAELSPGGRLKYFVAVPSQHDPAKEAPSTADWPALFKASGLDIAQFKPAEPEWTPPQWSDTRAAWTGVAAGRPGVPLRVEAAAFRGKPVYFQMIWPWTRPERMQPEQPTAWENVVQTVVLVMFLAVLIGAVYLARRNLRLGRGDRRGAFRLAVFVLVVYMLSWGAAAHHLPAVAELGLFLEGGSLALLNAGLVWLLYIGLEPYVRRRWPKALISWSRVLAGQFRDPLVGRDVLTGATLGVGLYLWYLLGHFADGWIGSVPPAPMEPLLSPLFGLRAMVGLSLRTVPNSLGLVMLLFFLLFLLRLLLRKDWLAATVFVLIFVVGFGLPTKYPLVNAVFIAVAFGSFVFILLQFGLFSSMVFFLVEEFLEELVLTTNFPAWYAASTIVGVLLVLALAIYGFRVSLAGRPVFSSGALDE
jgi:serine/threonine-protein kinase